MRAGACTVQQTLTSEAASVVKLSLSLARRRGHAQVTPLHVAATLLSSRTSLLRRACLKSHPHQSSHPLQCRALELCFNVALNRLPTSPSPLIHSQPSLSNALIAALKRAQAHQRRGSIEQQQQQQPFLAIKVELEQLIISILDDPSVSRVMREAGFSSTSVKNNLENSSCSVEIQPSFWPTNFFNSHFNAQFNAQLIDSSVEKKEDLRLVLEVMLRKKRRNTIIVGDGLSSTEGLVVELMGKVDRGEVPEELRSVQFVKFQICPVSLKFMKREEVEMKVTDLRRKVGSLAMEGGVVIYVGDLKWAVEESCIREGGGILCLYNPIEHVIAEVGRLISDFDSCNNSKVWLIGIANYQTYMRCQMKTPPLEMQWSLQAVAVPSGGLALSLHASSGLDARTNLSQNPTQFVESKLSYAKEEQEMLICCRECTSNFEKEAGIFKSAQQKPQASFGLNDTDDSDKGSSHLPNWLQQHKAENHHKKDYLVELKRKWNRLCQSLHHPRHNQIQMNSSIFNQNSGRSYIYAPSYPWWSSSLQYKQNVFDDSNSISVSELVSKPRTNSTYIHQPKIHQPWSVELSNRAYKQNSSEMSSIPLKKVDNTEMKITLALGNPLFSDSVTSKDPMRGTKSLQDFCLELQENIHWQSEIIPAIAEAIHDYKLRVTKGTWLLIPGTDWIGKRRLARTIADSVFGSVDGIFHMNLRRIRENEAKSCKEILSNALRSDPKRVIVLEEIDCAEACFIKSLADGYKKGKFEDSHGKEVCTSDAVIIMTIGSAMNFSKDYNENPNSVIQMKFQFEQYNNYKRKAEWDSPNNGKSLRMGKKEDPLIIDECECSEIEKQQLSRQSSVANLDLNICAEDDEESNTAWSDLTQETAMEPDAPNWFLNSIDNRFIFNRNQAQLGQMLEKLRLKLERSFWEAFGREKKGFLWIDDEVLEEILEASGEFVESLFEKWLKDVFQTSVLTVKNGGKEVAAIRMSVKGKNGNTEMGFEGSGLPKTIQVVY